MRAKMNIRSIMATMVIMSMICVFFINISFATNTGKISTETAKLRSEPNTDSTVLELVSENDKVEVLEEENGWYKVKYNKITGYIRSDLVEVEGVIKENKEEQKETPVEEKQEETKSEEEKEEQNSEETKQEEENKEETKSEEKQEEKKEENKIELGKNKTIEDLKIRIIPLISSMQLGEVSKNSEVEVIQILSTWAKIKIDDGTEGWVRLDKLAAKTEDEDVEVSIKTMYVNTQTVNVREEPSTDSAVVKQLSKGDALTAVFTKDGWCYVNFDEYEGYISERLLSNTKPETTRAATVARNTETDQQSAGESAPAPVPTSSGSSEGNEIVEFAKQYIGCRYVYGGTTPNGFDCSGFARYVYSNFGVSLSRTAASQYGSGTPISKSDLQPGDLVFFGKSGINHVGIYAGGNTFVHAANTRRGVTTDSLSSSYYSTNYVGAKRIL